MTLAMKEDEQIAFSTEASPVRDTDSVVSPMSPELVELPANNEEDCDVDIIHDVRVRMSELANTRSSVGSSSKLKHTSMSSGSAATESDLSLLDGTSPTSWLSLNTSASPPPTSRISHRRMRSEQLLYGGSIDSRAFDDEIWPNDHDSETQLGAIHSRAYSDASYSHSNVMEAISSAMQQLLEARHQEKTSRSVRFEPQNQLHMPSDEILKVFEESVNPGSHTGRLITSDWLRVATWWLLKVR